MFFDLSTQQSCRVLCNQKPDAALFFTYSYANSKQGKIARLIEYRSALLKAVLCLPLSLLWGKQKNFSVYWFGQHYSWILGEMHVSIGMCCNPAANQNRKLMCGSQAEMLPRGRRKWLADSPHCHQKKMPMGGKWRSDETFEIHVYIWFVLVVHAGNCRLVSTCKMGAHWEKWEVRLKCISEYLNQERWWMTELKAWASKKERGTCSHRRLVGRWYLGWDKGALYKAICTNNLCRKSGWKKLMTLKEMSWEDLFQETWGMKQKLQLLI